MRLPLKLSPIEREHLQEVYDAVGVARDELPYTESFEQLYQSFQDRTFKNAEREQVFGTLLKYVRSSSVAGSNEPADLGLSDEQLKQLRLVISRHATSGPKLLPYSDEIDGARGEFNQLAGTQLDERQFWQATQQASGPKRRPPKRTAKAAKAAPAEGEPAE